MTTCVCTVGFEGVTGANVVLGGISFGQDPTPRVVGEIPLSTTYQQSSEVMTAPPGAAPALPAEGTPPPPPAAQPSTL